MNSGALGSGLGVACAVSGGAAAPVSPGVVCGAGVLSLFIIDDFYCKVLQKYSLTSEKIRTEIF
jgi:hypothetical protein